MLVEIGLVGAVVFGAWYCVEQDIKQRRALKKRKCTKPMYCEVCTSLKYCEEGKKRCHL